MENGNLRGYLDSLVRLEKLSGVTFVQKVNQWVCHLLISLSPSYNYDSIIKLYEISEGLLYLHGMGIAHGDIRGVCGHPYIIALR